MKALCGSFWPQLLAAADGLSDPTTCLASTGSIHVMNRVVLVFKLLWSTLVQQGSHR